MVYVVAVGNQKGGVAKTTTAANVADEAAGHGLRVLLVDLDPQANATTLTDATPRQAPTPFGTTQDLTVSDALYHAVPGAGSDRKAGTALAVVTAAGDYWAPSLHVVPASADLARRGAEAFEGVDERLAVALSGAEAHYDLVVVDCPPSLGTLWLAALHAADGVLLVSELADNALEALPKAAESVYRVAAQRGAGAPALLGVVATNVPGREARAGELLGQLREQYGATLWEVVPRRAVVRQAEGAHAPLRAYGAQARDVVEVHERITGRLLEAADLTPREVVA